MLQETFERIYFVFDLKTTSRSLSETNKNQNIIRYTANTVQLNAHFTCVSRVFLWNKVTRRSGPRLFFKYGIVEHRADTMAQRCLSKWNGTDDDDDDDDGDGFCIVRKQADGVSRVLSHSYNARDTHGGTYFTYRGSLTRLDGRPRSIMAVENGPSIDSRTRRATCTSRMDGFIRREALADRCSTNLARAGNFRLQVGARDGWRE